MAAIACCEHGKAPTACVICLAEEAFNLRDELAQAQQWVHDLQAGMYINCVYCGHRYGPDDEIPATMADALKEHIESCPKHPMSALKRELNQAQADISTLQQDVAAAESELVRADTERQKAQDDNVALAEVVKWTLGNEGLPSYLRHHLLDALAKDDSKRNGNNDYEVEPIEPGDTTYKRYNFEIEAVEEEAEAEPEAVGEQEQGGEGMNPIAYSKAIEDVLEEVISARQKFPSFNSAYEGYAVLLEEVEELWVVVRTKTATKQERYDEARQVAAMAVCFMVEVAVPEGERE